MIKNRSHKNKHNQFLVELPKLSQQSKYLKILYSPKEFNSTLLHAIHHAYNHIYLVTLYLENDQGGKSIINSLLTVKKLRPNITIKIIVDWYRAQRNRIGSNRCYTNLNWYKEIVQQYPDIEILIYGVPINIGEALGVLHLKGFIIDDMVLYSGANINNEYLYIYDRYRYDRYHIINNKYLSNIMLKYIEQELLSSKVTNRLGFNPFFKKKIRNKNKIRLFRKKLRTTQYKYQGNATFYEFSITPLVGLGKNSILNQTIYHLISSVKNRIILCTPYFNIPKVLIYNLKHLLHTGKTVEIIVGDKTANDFYDSQQEYKPFKFINALPYWYEINLRNFLKQLQKYIDSKQLIIRLWKDQENGYHIKGIWIDDEWQLLTGSNLNPRSLRYDLENALLIHDPLFESIHQVNKELNKIRKSTVLIQHYSSIEEISNYPVKVRQLIQRIHHIKFDRLINRFL